MLLPGRPAAGGELSADVAALHEGGLPDLAVDEEVVEGERRQGEDARRDQLEVADGGETVCVINQPSLSCDG